MKIKQFLATALMSFQALSLPAFNPSLLSAAPLVILGSSALAELYTRIPQELFFRNTPPPLPNIINSNIFLVFPGAGGVDVYTDAVVESAINTFQSNKNLNDYYIQCYDWKPWRGNFLRAAYDSESVGKRLGRQLARINAERSPQNRIQSIHTIGISVGSFAADACINEFKSESKRLSKPIFSTLKSNTITNANNQKEHTFCHLTLLDPFCSKGIYNIQYGEKEFGKQADFVEQYMNTDDVVPFTNKPVINAYCYDITNSNDRNMFIPREGDTMHSWPGISYIIYYIYVCTLCLCIFVHNVFHTYFVVCIVAYYAKKLVSETGQRPSHSALPRGVTEQVL